MNLEDYISQNPNSRMANIAVNSFEYRLLDTVASELERIEKHHTSSDNYASESIEAIQTLTGVLARMLIAISFGKREGLIIGIEAVHETLKVMASQYEERSMS